MSKAVIPQNINIERLKRVKKDRQIQLRRWLYFEKEIEKKIIKVKNQTKKHIEFSKDTMFLEAVSRNDIIEVTELLNQGVNPNATIVDGLTALHQCCIDNYVEMAQLLIKYNTDVNSVDSEKWTPLHAAATCGNGEICLLLSANGADFLALNSDGNMPYDICEGVKALKIIESEMEKKGITQKQIDDARMVPEQEMLKDVNNLRQSKSDLNQLDRQGAALIHIACSLGYSEVVKTLLESRADYSLADKNGWLPVHLAARWGHVDVVECLAVFGADIDAQTATGETAFDVCDGGIRENLIHIKENIIDIRNTYNFHKFPVNKSFRHSRRSLVRRTSMHQKNLLSKKEAKEEFLVLTQAPQMNGYGNDQEFSDQNSDVDSPRIRGQSPDNAQCQFEKENSLKAEISRCTNRNNNNSHFRVINNHSTTTVKNASVEQALSISDKYSNNKSNDAYSSKQPSSPPHKELNKSPRKSPLMNIEVNADVEALDKPRYVFRSIPDHLYSKNECKRKSRRECCAVL